MKIHEIIHETPMMVPQSGYPGDFKRSAIQSLKRVNPSDLENEFHKGDIRIMSRDDGEELFLFFKGVAAGVMALSPAHNVPGIGAPAWQVWNVYVLPEYRNKRLGLALYNFVLHHRKEAFASGAAMTPASRRIYSSLLKDPTVDVYALVYKSVGVGRGGKFSREELHIGPDGVTTGDELLDNTSTFVAVAK